MTMPFQLLPGDQFLTVGNNPGSRIITWMEKIYALDRQAEFSHAGLIWGSNGTTFESRLKIGQYNLGDHAGKRVLIARCSIMEPLNRLAGREAVAKHEGEWYPFMRLPLHALRLSQYIHWRTPVCSELVCKFNYYAMPRDFPEFMHYFGWTPDHLHDVYKRWKHWDIIFDDILKMEYFHG